MNILLTFIVAASVGFLVSIIFVTWGTRRTYRRVLAMLLRIERERLLMQSPADVVELPGVQAVIRRFRAVYEV